MKYRFVAENPLEEQALKSHPAIRPLFEPFLSVLQARSLMAGVRLGVFEAIAHESKTIGQLAQTLSLNAEGLALLLRVLACAGYVTHHENEYQLSELAQQTLLPGSPTGLSGWMEYNYLQWEMIDHLEESLKTGKGIDIHQSLVTPSDWAIHQRAMLETARMAAPGVASVVPIKQGACKMLDLGGSHGLYGAMICRNHPPMRSEVLELPEAVEHARKLGQAEGIDDVVSYRAGDALTDDLGSDYDAVFLGNLVHHFTPDQNLKLVQRIKAALTPEGTIVIWDFKRTEADAEPDLIGDGLALFFHITSAAQCYTPADYTSWIKAAGFVEVTIHQIPAPAQILITGRAPSN